MNELAGKERRINTSHGIVRIRSFCTPHEIRQFTFDEEFLSYAQYKTIYTQRESLEKDAATPDANVVLALTENDHIIGFGVLVYPEKGERWLKLGFAIMMEVKVIEICRSWRSEKIASQILEQVVDHPDIESKIAYMVGYSWTWDLDHSRLKAQEYRQILIRLFGSCGFTEYETNEPNICMKVENLFMCRVGKNVPDDIVDRFNWLRFGIIEEETASKTEPTPIQPGVRKTSEHSLFTPLIAEGFTSVRIFYNWKTDCVNLYACREWEKDVAWSHYNQTFTTEHCLSSDTEYLGNKATRELYQKYDLIEYLDEVIENVKMSRHQGIECFFNAARDIRLINYMHSSTLGQDHIYRALRSGGICFTDFDRNEIDMLSEGLNLSRAMSFKNASARVPFGGCRISILTEPLDLSDREGIGFISYCLDRTRSFAGPDMGFQPELVDVMRREGFTTHITGGWDSKVGPPGPPTAFGVYLAVKEAAYVKFNSLNLAGKKIVVQGVGSVGLPLIERYLINENADLYLADIDEKPIEQLRLKFPGQIKVLQPDQVLSFKGDIWIPCATGGVVTETNMDQIQYAIITGAANNTIKAGNQREEVRLAQLLGQKGILFQIDWLHNTAGIIGGAEEYMYQNKASFQRVMEQVEKVCRDGVRQNLKNAAENDITPTEQAYRHFNRMIY